jgi:hypothetical protein
MADPILEYLKVRGLGSYSCQVAQVSNRINIFAPKKSWISFKKIVSADFNASNYNNVSGASNVLLPALLL